MNGLGIQVLSDEVLSVYPNPANSILNINFPGGFKNQNYSIYDVSGKLVLNGVINQNSINIESLTDGIYFLELNSDKNSDRMKFIKN
jgi:hypothetical protein